MSDCKFLKQLNRLRKSSSDSIDDVEIFDSYKEYMHVIRTVEKDLKDILKNVNQSNKKTLVLLCGSAGDGKSHLLSYLKNFDREHLIDDYIVYNDATESRSPSKTAIETLSDFLTPFKDVNLDSEGKNIILAINLGVLSNFVDSDYASEFKILRKYVEESNILTNQVNNNDYNKDSHFQHVSFSDYHVYNLTKTGVHAEYIEKIFEKIFGRSGDNVFFRSYQECCGACPLSRKCPVKMNYEYMMKKSRQKCISELLIKCVIQGKLILTTREILNFVYDMLVSKRFDYKYFQELSISDFKYLNEFIQQVTPTLLFDSVGTSIPMDMLAKYDPLLIRSENSDETAISYYVSSDVTGEMEKVFFGKVYDYIVCESTMVRIINDENTLKSNIYKLMVRLNAIEDVEKYDRIYTNYLRDLYSYNLGDEKHLVNLYNMVKNAVVQWCGADEVGNLCLDSRHKDFCLYEEVKFNPVIGSNPSNFINYDELERFVPSIVVRFKDFGENKIELNIDYSLYVLLDKLNHGYIQTANDKNNHADFINFINKILRTGSLTEKVSIISGSGKRAIVSKNVFGYKFWVVK